MLLFFCNTGSNCDFVVCSLYMYAAIQHVKPMSWLYFYIDINFTTRDTSIHVLPVRPTLRCERDDIDREGVEFHPLHRDLDQRISNYHWQDDRLEVMWCNGIIIILGLTNVRIVSGGFYEYADHVTELNNMNFTQQVASKSHIWMVEFYAEWCGHCQRFKPTWVQLANDIQGV